MKVRDLIDTLEKIENKDAEILVSINGDKLDTLGNVDSDLIYIDIKTEDPKDVEDLMLLFLDEIVML